MIERKLRKTLRATLLALPDAALAYVRDESDKEWKRRRDKVRERRRARAAAEPVGAFTDGI